MSRRKTPEGKCTRARSDSGRMTQWHRLDIDGEGKELVFSSARSIRRTASTGRVGHWRRRLPSCSRIDPSCAIQPAAHCGPLLFATDHYILWPAASSAPSDSPRLHACLNSGQTSRDHLRGWALRLAGSPRGLGLDGAAQDASLIYSALHNCVKLLVEILCLASFAP